MEFISSRPDVVRSISQSWLLNHWNRLHGIGSLPKWQELDGGELGAMTENLSYTDVVGSDSAARYLIRFH